MALFILTYFCVAIFVIAAGVRVYRQIKLPLHLRWELYPVKHEKGEKAEYGGSYMEESNWWKKERKKSLWNEIKFMVPEILLMRGLREENKRLWAISFPFHFGLYCLVGTLVLLAGGAVALGFGVPIAPGGGLRSWIYYWTILLGFIGLTAGPIGAVGLLHRRFTDPELKSYSALADYLNLLLLLFFLGTSLLAWLFHDHGFDGARAYIYGLLTFGGQPAGHVSNRTLLGSLAIVSASVVVAYIPLTHMSHMFIKYFMYHAVRWEDTPNLKGGKMEAAILKNLGFKPTWAAPHIGADGQKTWGEIAVSKPKEKK